MQRQRFGRSSQARGAKHVRSLLSGEALEENLGVRIDAKVLDGLGVRRGTLGVTSSLHGSSIPDGREGVTAEGLHDDERNSRKGLEEKRGERRGTRRMNGRVAESGREPVGEGKSSGGRLFGTKL